jgi:hypothetical protein
MSTTFTTRRSYSLFHSLVRVPWPLIPAFVIQITVSKNSPIFGVQSNETNQLDRFFICCESAFCNTSAAILTG